MEWKGYSEREMDGDQRGSEGQFTQYHGTTDYIADKRRRGMLGSGVAY